MKRRTAKKANMLLYVLLMMTIPVMIYLQMHNEVAVSMLLLGVMFVIAMTMFWISAKEHEADRPVPRKGMR